jgi:AcrR family transcriptional regulator
MLVTNIDRVTPRIETRERLAATALDLFEAHGYDATTVEDIARAAGVSHMTFFRYFPTKESVLLGDPFDPVIAASVAAQPGSLPPIERVARGFLVALRRIDEAFPPDAAADVRRRIRIAAGVPALRAGVVENNRETEDAIVDALRATGTPEGEARIAAAACLGAATASLMAWATADSDASLAQVVTGAVLVVVPHVKGEAS